MTPQNFARGCLLLSASVRSRLLFEFLEQPHILDGDDGLIGEGLE